MKKVHLGCGSVILPDWDNLDLDPPPGGIHADLRGTLFYADESVDIIYHEHFIEHLTREEGVRLFKDIYRVLKPGGVVRFSTPDLKIIMSDYKNKRLNRAKGAWDPETPAQMVNGALRNWGHKFVYDQDELEMVLQEAGFKTFARRNYRKSEIQELVDIERRPWLEEIIIEATK